MCLHGASVFAGILSVYWTGPVALLCRCGRCYSFFVNDEFTGGFVVLVTISVCGRRQDVRLLGVYIVDVSTERKVCKGRLVGWVWV